MTDRKLNYDNNSDGIIDYYTADLKTTTDYYVFGAPLPERQFNSPDYRYTFNGKETDLQTTGVKNMSGTQDYGMRIYNPALGKFLSIDPLASKYPMLTPYQFATNRPIDGIDMDGLEWKATQDKEGKYTGFIWDSENAYDEKGGLKEGYYLSAIKFEDEATFNPNSNFNMGTAGAWVYTTKQSESGALIGVINYYDATIYPADPQSQASVKPGVLFEAKIGLHKGKTALVTTNLTNGSDHIPVRNDYNPAHPERNDEALGGGYADGIHIHWSYPGPNGKQTTGFDSKGNACSEGCLLIDRTYYSKFIGNFKNGEKIGVIIKGGIIPTPRKPDKETQVDLKNIRK